MTDRTLLPPNPYRRTAIKNPQDLAGRDNQLSQLRYYLRLTASGQSPHLAIIGKRGVGKTSLLNAGESIAQDLSLLPVRIDLNIKKAQTLGHFWYDFYTALILAAAQAGCWGGANSQLYAALTLMLHGRVVPPVDQVVLQFPLSTARQTCPWADIECSDALIVHDLKYLIREELSPRGIKGVVFLIDEADCLNQDVSVIQMCRNVFQRTDAASLVMAGTEAVFETLSEVFSPIPRQFHRISVGPFSEWTDTRSLILRPLPSEWEDVAPESGAIQELHQVCGGDPAELQLYCHSMFKLLEFGVSDRMSLRPEVFKEVLREYREQASPVLEKTLEAIEATSARLADSAFLRYRRLNVDENVRFQQFLAELHEEQVTDEMLARIDTVVRNSYKTLCDRGITASDTDLSLVGSPLTDGFWKSYLEVERGKRWTWSDERLTEAFRNAIVQWICDWEESVMHYELSEEPSAAAVLMRIRANEPVRSVNSESVVRTMSAMMAGRELGFDAAYNVTIQVSVEASSKRYHIICRGDAPSDLMTLFTERVHARAVTFDQYQLSVDVEKQSPLWTFPNQRELQRLAHIAAVPIFYDELGKALGQEGLEWFAKGDVERAIECYALMASDRSDTTSRNNLAYLLAIGGRHREALEQASLVDAQSFTPLKRHNLAVIRALNGERADAVEKLQRLDEWLVRNEHSYDPTSDAFCMMVLTADGDRVLSHEGVPVDVSVWLNLYRLGAMDREGLEARIKRRYARRFEALAGIVPR